MKKASGKSKGVMFKPATANELIDLLSREKGKQLGGAISKQSLPPTPDILKIRNATGSDLPGGAVVDIGDLLFDESEPLKLDYPWFEVVTQAGGAWGVMRRATPDEDIEECQISGICIARVNILNIDHTRAIPKAGQAYFESSHMGPVRILRLSDTDATGVQECFVLLRVPIFTLLGIAVDVLGHNTAGTVNLVKKISSGSGYEYMRNGSSAHFTVESYAYSLQAAEEIAVDTAVFLNQLEDGTFQAISGNCTARDWELEDED